MADRDINGLEIKAIGIGGAGNKVIDMLIRFGFNADFIAVDTEEAQLTSSLASRKIRIGKKLTGGQSAGANFALGREAAEEARGELSNAIEGTDILFLLCGLGGGTGTGAAPVIANIAREAGAVTVGIVSKPFDFEGGRCREQADIGFMNLASEIDALFVVENQAIWNTTKPETTQELARNASIDALRSLVPEVAEALCRHDAHLGDTQRVLDRAGLTHIGSGVGQGYEMVRDAVTMAASNKLLGTSIKNARSLIVNIYCSPDIDLERVDEVINVVTELVNEEVEADSDIVAHFDYDPELANEMRVTIVASRYNDKPIQESAPVETSDDEDLLERIAELFRGK